MKNQPQRDILEATHEFPGEYTLKAFGPTRGSFVSDVSAAAAAVHASSKPIHVSTRESSGGAHVCVTVILQVASPDDVFALYDSVKAIDGVRMIL